ncbi:hypothetical protein [Yersinia phage fHe-Yen9-04]|uniref:Uncharacterized protein n=1 Tax=Yersinia phage fHe-Yen9-04 TaxID=2052742 RepID=A0A2C9CWX1_9CAUD|nr:hypothetical protein FDJ41_gp006 [Yersinia phage fHe-Yen9-04]SOK58283.1 hypothetical protein [Yersinia phage fHe-Yen9-04]VUE36052.1 hypothetical protein [Yersinia phage fHe-Yen9-04]
MLHVKGFSEGGYCFMIGDKPVSVVEALQKNGKKFNKNTLNALNRNNLANESDLVSFELQVQSLHKGLTPEYVIQILRNEYNIDFNNDFHELSSASVLDLLTVYHIAQYRAPSPCNRDGSPMRYFYQYLQRFIEKKK